MWGRTSRTLNARWPFIFWNAVRVTACTRAHARVCLLRRGQCHSVSVIAAQNASEVLHMLRSGVRPVPRSGSDAVSEWLHTELARAGVGMDAVPRVVDVVMPLLRAKDAEIARLRMAGEGTQVTVG